MKTRYTFKASFLDGMSLKQRNAWIQAAEEIMRGEDILFQRAMLDDHVTYILDKEEDYYTLCDLSADIGKRALQIESQDQDNTLSVDSPARGRA